MAHRALADKDPADREDGPVTGTRPTQIRCRPAFNSPMNADQELSWKARAGPHGTLLSRTGTTPGNPSATSTQLPPS